MTEEMSFQIIEKEKDSIKLEIVNSDNTILRPLIEEISKDPMVDEITYHIDHPTLDNPVLYIKVKEGKPQNAVKRGLNKLQKYFEDMDKLLKKELTKK